MRPEQAKTENSQLSLFSLPLEVLRECIIKRLNLEGPAVEWVTDDLSEEQKKNNHRYQ